MTVAAFRWKNISLGIPGDQIEKLSTEDAPEGVRIVPIHQVLGEDYAQYVKPVLAYLTTGPIALEIDCLEDIVEVAQQDLLMLPPLICAQTRAALYDRAVCIRETEIMLLVDARRIRSET